MRHLPTLLALFLPAAAAGDWTAGDSALTLKAPELGVELELTRREAPMVDTLRKGFQANWHTRDDGSWRFESGLRVERRSGSEILAGTMGSTGGNARAVLLRAPVDHETREWTGGAHWRGESMDLTARFLLARFSNDERAFTFQNPFTQVAGWAPGVGLPDGFGSVAREPGNRARDLALAWSWRGPAGVAVNADIGFGQHRQDEVFLPYTINPTLNVTEPLPRTALDGRVDRSRYGLRTRWPIAPALHLDLRWRDERHDDRTEPAWFRMVGGDAVNQPPTPASNAVRLRLPRDLRRARIDGALDWRIGRQDRLRWSWQQDRQERFFAEVARTLEHTHALEWRRAGPLGAHLRFETADRKGDGYRHNLPFLLSRTDEYLATFAPGFDFENHPLLRRFNLADRRRDTWRGGLSWAGENWHLGMLVDHRSERYYESFFGLVSSGQRGWHADAERAVGEHGHLTLWLSQERWRTRQEGRHIRGAGFTPGDVNNTDRDWTAHTLDRATVGGIAWRHRAPWEGGEFGVDLSQSRNTADVTVVAGAAIATLPLPAVSTRIRRVSVSLGHAFSDDLRLRVALDHEQWNSRDWAYDGVTDTTIPTVIGVGETLPQGGFGWASLRLSWRF